MRIYVASSWRNTFQPGVVEALRADGHKVYDFKGPGDGWGHGGDGPGGFAWSEVGGPNWKNWVHDIPSYITALDHPRAVEGFRRDMDALELADACVMVMPCGPSASMEMGWACGSGIYVAVYIPEMREPDLMVKMADLISSDLGDIQKNLNRHLDWLNAADRHMASLNAKHSASEPQPVNVERSQANPSGQPQEAKI